MSQHEAADQTDSAKTIFGLVWHNFFVGASVLST
jgi:hypothetical protein